MEPSDVDPGFTLFRKKGYNEHTRMKNIVMQLHSCKHEVRDLYTVPVSNVCIHTQSTQRRHIASLFTTECLQLFVFHIDNA